MRIKHLHFIVLFQVLSNFTLNVNYSFAQTKDSLESIFIYEDLNYDSLIIFKESSGQAKISIIKKGNLFGLVNHENKLILPIEYDSIEYNRLSLSYIITKDKLQGILTDEGILTVPIIYEHIEYDWKENDNNKSYGFIVQKNKKIGSIDFQNNTIIPIIYDGLSNWVEYGPDAHYVKRGDLYGLIDCYSGNLIIPPVYEGLAVHRLNLVEVKKNGHYGIVDYDNNFIIPCKYNSIHVDLNWMNMSDNYRELIYASTETEELIFELDGKLVSKKGKSKIDNRNENTNVDFNEYDYQLVECMIFPK
jgi:hypothetical protein